MRTSCWLVALVVWACGASAWAQVNSGPSAGEKAPPLKVFAVTGAVENKEVDYTAERKDRPTIYVFIYADTWSRPTARFLKTLDKEIKADSTEAYVVAVWLSEKPDESKDYLPKAQQSLQFERTALAVYQGDKAGPKEWTINSMAGLTAVVVSKGKVATTFGYQGVNETDVPQVRKALKKAVGGK